MLLFYCRFVNVILVAFSLVYYLSAKHSADRVSLHYNLISKFLFKPLTSVALVANNDFEAICNFLKN